MKMSWTEIRFVINIKCKQFHNISQLVLNSKEIAKICNSYFLALLAKFNGHTSEQLSITHGVPQGSLFGPLLFSIFINYLPKASKFQNFYLFVDDTDIYYESSDLIDIQKIVNRELQTVCEWPEANRGVQLVFVQVK